MKIKDITKIYGEKGESAESIVGAKNSGYDKKMAERIVREVKEDFAVRQSERRMLERNWELNMNFLAGNQYCDIGASGEIVEEEPRFYWQYRRVFNHIAPAIDTRCAKLSRVRPQLIVRAASDQEGDLRTAKISSNVLKSVCEENSFEEVMSKATVWSETCGTSFYKIVWDGTAGRCLGQNESGSVYEGAVRISAVPPFEIYPENLGCENIEDQPSILHVKALPVSEIEEKYGVKIPGRDISEFSFAPCSSSQNFVGAFGVRSGNTLKNCELVIERYEKPTSAFPQGRFIVVAGNELVYVGDLPYLNGASGTRTYPFVKQCAIELSGSFFGNSIIDRMIPVQRAFNALKNRTHEFINRLTMGILAVEDGSVDTDDLAEEGLPPGKVIVYRQGAKPPELLGKDSIPSEFFEEEQRLLNEFIQVSGVSEISSTSQNRTQVTSATGLQLLIDLDDTRLAVTTDSIRRAVKKAGQHILRLMREFAGEKRLMRMTGEGGKVDLYYFGASDISSDDVVFVSDTEDARTPSESRSLIYEIYKMGLLSDEEGKISVETKRRVLNALGYGGLENARGLAQLHANKASEENLRLMKEYVGADAYDDAKIHTESHIRFLLSDEFRDGSPQAKDRFIKHLGEHAEYAEKGSAVQNRQSGSDGNNTSAQN